MTVEHAEQLASHEPMRPQQRARKVRREEPRHARIVRTQPSQRDRNRP